MTQKRESCGARPNRDAAPTDALAELSGIVAHELNNFLTAVLGQTDIAELRADDREHVATCMRDIRAAAERARALARQLLALAGRGRASPRYIRLDERLAELRETLARTVGEHIQIELHTQPDVGCVFIDPGHFEQIVLNLGEFARDCMPTGGALTFQVRSLTTTCGARPADPRSPPPGEYVVLTASHAGPPIAAEDLPYVFEPCAAAGRPGAARLALPAARRIVERAGGTIALESRPGEQTRVQITFPRAADGDVANGPNHARPTRAS